MLPDLKNLPTGVGECFIRIDVTVVIGGELSPPPVGIRLRLSSVQRASVPKTAVDEDGNSKPSERDVDGPPRPSGNGDLDAVAESSRM